MKLKHVIAIFGALALAACDADIEPIDQRMTPPAEQNPAAWAEYVATLRAYKSSAHYTTFVRFDNAAAKPVSEKNSLRSLPDSLDIVALANPLSDFDREDLCGLHEKGTRVLLTADCSDPASAAKNAADALAAVAADGLDGVVLKCECPTSDAAKTALAAVVQQLAAQSGLTTAFAGNAGLLAAADRAKMDLYLLDATATASVTALQSDVSYYTGFLGIPAAKILPAVRPSGTIADLGGRELEAPTGVGQQTVALSLNGLALYDVAADYYSPAGTYPRIRGAIELLNPAHK